MSKRYLQKSAGGILLSCLLIFLFTFQLDNRPFATPDEGRYVEIPREMVASGNYLTPRLNGVKYFEKPPLFYWLQAGAIKAFGLEEGPMRLWVVFFGLMGCLATYAFAKAHFGRPVALLSSFILGTSVLYFCLGRLIILDMPVSVLVTLILYSFYQGFQAEAGPSRRFWFYCFSSCCALGVLTKGIMALAIPGPVIVLWLTLTGQWGKVLPLYLPTSLILFSLIAVPWHVLVSLQNPEFAYKYFIVEHFLRYTTDVHLRYQPIWFFIPILIVGFLPWTAFLPKAIRAAWTERSNPLNSYLLLWAGWVFVFFSISNSKLIPYILPLFPPMAILVGKYLTEVRKGFHGYSLFSIFLCAAGFVIVSFFPELLAEKQNLLKYVYGLMGLFFTSACFIYFIPKHKIASVSVTAVAVLLTLIHAAPFMQRPSVKPLTEIIQAHRQPGDRIVSFMSYYQDLPVYTTGIVTVVEAKGELEFGTTVQDTTAWMIKEEQFLNLWSQNQKIWAVGRKTELERFQKRHPDFVCQIVAEDSGNILFTQ